MERDPLIDENIRTSEISDKHPKITSSEKPQDLQVPVDTEKRIVQPASKRGFKSINVEAENNELILRNSHGDYTIIPSRYREWIKQKVEEGCNDCIDQLVSTLPSVSDYAEDGSVFPFGTEPITLVKPSGERIETDTNNDFYRSVYNRNLIGNKNEDGSWNLNSEYLGVEPIELKTPDNNIIRTSTDSEAYKAYYETTPEDNLSKDNETGMIQRDGDNSLSLKEDLDAQKLDEITIENNSSDNIMAFDTEFRNKNNK